MKPADLAGLTRQVLTTANALRLADLVGRERDHALLAAAALDDLRHLLLDHEGQEHDQLEITDALHEISAAAHRPTRSADVSDEEDSCP